MHVATKEMSLKWPDTDFSLGIPLVPYTSLKDSRENHGQTFTGLNLHKIPQIIWYHSRFLARLHLTSNPSKDHSYAIQAASLGDIGAEAVLAEILDSGNVSSTTHTSTNRVELMGQLLAKLDPEFSYNVNKSEKLRTSGFITYMAGLCINYIIIMSILNNLYRSMAWVPSHKAKELPYWQWPILHHLSRNPCPFYCLLWH